MKVSFTVFCFFASPSDVEKNEVLVYGPYTGYLDGTVIDRNENYTVMCQSLPRKKERKNSQKTQSTL